MNTVTLSLHCYSGDRDALYKNLDKIFKSHNYPFDSVQVVHQRCEPDFDKTVKGISYITIPAEKYDWLLENFDIPANDKRADEITHGPTSAHYWKNHCVNHLAGALHTDADYIVFSDSDCIMIRNDEPGWIKKAIEVMESDPSIFVVSPSDGAPGRQWIMSQQLFLVNRVRFMGMDFNCWDGNYIEGGPMAEFFCMLEGKISMYMLKHKLCRLVLPDEYRYFHDWVHHTEPKHLYDMAMEALK